MKVFPEKRKELTQALDLLIRSIRKEKGCSRCDFCYSAEDENEFCLIGEWEKQESLNRHTESELFKILLGAMNLLTNPREIKFYAGLTTNQSPDLAGECGQCFVNQHLKTPSTLIDRHLAAREGF